MSHSKPPLLLDPSGGRFFLPDHRALYAMLSNVDDPQDAEMFRLILSTTELSIEEKVQRAHDATMEPLALSVETGNIPLVEALLSAGLNPATKDAAGRTPLHQAALHNATPAVAVLLRFGADIEARDNLGSTPLHLAATMKNLEVAQDLVRRGANLHAQNEVGNSPLMMAVDSARGDVRVVDFLIEQGGDVHAINKGDHTCLMLAANHGDVACAERLIRAGAALDQQEKNGWQAVHCAARFGHADFIDFLVEEGADLDACTPDGVTPLMAAIEGNRFDCAIRMIQSGADVHGATSKDGRTALHIAAEKGSGASNVAMALVEAGAELSRQDAFSCTPVTIAEQGGDYEWGEQMEAFLSSVRAKRALELVMASTAAKMNPSAMALR